MEKVTFSQALKTIGWFDYAVGGLLISLTGFATYSFYQLGFANAALSMAVVGLVWFGMITGVRKRVMQENGGKWV